jgi:hypothetical protein
MCACLCPTSPYSFQQGILLTTLHVPKKSAAAMPPQQAPFAVAQLEEQVQNQELALTTLKAERARAIQYLYSQKSCLECVFVQMCHAWGMVSGTSYFFISLCVCVCVCAVHNVRFSSRWKR